MLRDHFMKFFVAVRLHNPKGGRTFYLFHLCYLNYSSFKSRSSRQEKNHLSGRNIDSTFMIISLT